MFNLISFILIYFLLFFTTATTDTTDVTDDTETALDTSRIMRYIKVKFFILF